MFNPHPIDSIWPEKYRPKLLSDYIFHSELLSKQIAQIVESKTIPNMLLNGPPGCGKSALAKLLIELCIDPSDVDMDVLRINASSQNSIENVRNEIHNHVVSMGSGPYKVVWLEECDRLSVAAQRSLLDYMEQYESQCRFLLTCNYMHRLEAAFKSRCQVYTLQSCPKDDVVETVANMLITEQVEFTLDILDAHINAHYPDVRSVIHSVEQCSINGKLLHPSTTDINTVNEDVVDMIKRDDWTKLRTFLCSTVQDDAWEPIYVTLYENLDKSATFSSDRSKWGEGILIIADHLDKHYKHGKPHINAASMFIQLDNWCKS